VKRALSLAALTLTLAACAGQASPTATVRPTAARPTTTPPPSATPIITPQAEATEATRAGLPLPAVQGRFFSGSGACAPCHAGMTDDTGANVSIDAAWRSTMMANSARDPYFLASVRAESLRHPERREEIEDVCATCHMPMGRTTLAADGGRGTIFEGGLADPEHDLNALAMDGVSCSVCHQIRESNLGPESYSGQFLIDTQTPVGERLVFGPYTVEDDQAAIMQAASGYLPSQAMPWGGSLHIAQSELCATCHTLYTQTLDASGEPAGFFPEQVPYLEWFYSSYRRTRTCQSCHMPYAQGGVRIASSSVSPRSPFSQHIFVGGNAYVLQMLSAFGEDLGVTASERHFEATIAHTLEQLQTSTATVGVENINRTGARLTLEVVVQNLAGHKFPTGFPSRRAWLHLTLRAADGQVVFESGAFNPDGSIVGNNADADPAAYEPHYQTIVSPEQVQIYEAILRDTRGLVTTELMTAAGYLKDNRLLPSGFEKSAPYPDIAVRGEAFEDPDFVDGGDRVQYSIPLGEARGPLTLTVELLYQSIGFRWASNFGDLEAVEISRFQDYYEAIPNTPVVVASQTIELEE
jgi:hypothetical protein